MSFLVYWESCAGDPQMDLGVSVALQKLANMLWYQNVSEMVAQISAQRSTHCICEGDAMFCIVAKFIGHVKKVLPLLSIDLSSCCWVIVCQCILPIICMIGSNIRLIFYKLSLQYHFADKLSLYFGVETGRRYLSHIKYSYNINVLRSRNPWLFAYRTLMPCSPHPSLTLKFGQSINEFGKSCGWLCTTFTKRKAVD